LTGIRPVSYYSDRIATDEINITDYNVLDPVNHLNWIEAEMIFSLPWARTEARGFQAEYAVAYGLNHLTIGEYQGKHPVAGWDQGAIKGFTTGIKTVAGSMVFTNPSIPFTNQLVKSFSSAVYQSGSHYQLSVTDLPPMNVTVVVPYSNSEEYYSFVIKRLNFVDSNLVLFNVNNPQSMQSLSFICQGVAILD